jgi:3'(2'), 5'-bisphosphate nucleotidase
MTGAGEDLLAALRLIAERAGKIVLGYYAQVGKDGIDVRQKSDASPVTEADEACEAFILEALAKLTPDIPVISEEAAEAGGLPEGDVPERFWLVDPLDGTKEFLNRNGEFTVNIGLVENGRPVAGVVHAPALAKTWAGAEAGSGGLATFSTMDQPPSEIAAREIPAEGATVVASRRHGGGGELDAFLAEHEVKELIGAGSSLKFCLIASGEADIYPRFGRTMEWDTCAAHAVLKAAGGRVETLDGAELTYGKPGLDNPHFVAWGRR